MTTRTYFGSTNSVPVIQRTSCRSMTGNSNKSNEKPIVICGPSGVGKTPSFVSLNIAFILFLIYLSCPFEYKEKEL